ncbi:MAG: hypothetical protein L6R41_001512 [Letrouitia leprolyta]|nr:MAG: hypothetical protein L6R41_001512 [Letrouitia leprolyta]
MLNEPVSRFVLCHIVKQRQANHIQGLLCFEVNDLVRYLGTNIELFRNPYDTAVTVKVGSEAAQKSFVMHTELLTYHSAFFKAATAGNWDEAKTGVINLPEDDPEVFQLFLDWLYQPKLCLDDIQAHSLSLIFALWIFGDKKQAAVFQNAVIEDLRTFTNNAPNFSPGDMRFAFDNIAEGSSLRSFLVDISFWQSSIVKLLQCMLEEARYPKAFVQDDVERYFNHFPRPSPASIKKNRPHAINTRVYYVPQQESFAG